MKRKIAFWMAAFSAAGILAGCAKAPADRSWPETVQVSNLNDEATRELAGELLTLSGSEAQKQMFFDHVDQVNRFLKPEELTNGFEELRIDQPKYDPYELQARWEAEYPDFLGYNCRITAFSLMRNLVQIPQDTQSSPDYVLMDLFALEEDPSAIPDDAGQAQFQTLYTGVNTDPTTDLSVHVKNLQKSWEARGILFTEGKASLISVVLHDQIDGDRLFVGHTGILYEAGDGEFYFLEKLAFQEPYQLVRLSGRAELSDYLMAKYDVDFNQDTAAPFVMENNHLIEGYRAHSDTSQ